MDLYITAGIIILGIFLFIKEYFTIDTTSFLIMVSFIVTGVLTPEEGFSGFIHPATIILGCLFVLSAAILKTNILDSLSDRIVKIAKRNKMSALVVFCTVTAFFSAFVSDAATIAIMIPLATYVSKEADIKISKLLIPISFAACFGGSITLIGTSSNILVSAYVQDKGMDGFSMFEFSIPGLILLSIGFAYIFFIQPYLLPRKRGGSSDSLTETAEKYFTEIKIREDSEDIGCKVNETRLKSKYDVNILNIKRGDEIFNKISSNLTIKEGDILRVLITSKHLIDIKSDEDYEIDWGRNFKFEDGIQEDEEVSESDDESKEQETLIEKKKIFEVMVPYGSKLNSKSFENLNLLTNYNVSILAIRHRGDTVMDDLDDFKLKEGDMLLLFGTEQSVQNLKTENMITVASKYDKQKTDTTKAIIAIAIFLGVILSAALDFTSILMSGLVGALLVIITSVLKPSEAYEAINWKVIFMIAGVLSMSMALEKTGGSDVISNFIFTYFGNFSPYLVLSLFFLATSLMTNVISNRATAALMTPIAISLAGMLEVDVKPLLVAIIFACAHTFMTPLSNPTNAMVYSPGNYKFVDFIKAGAPLNFIIWIAASFLIPLFFPF